MVNLDSGNNCYYVDKNLLQITNANSCEVIASSGRGTSVAASSAANRANTANAVANVANASLSSHITAATLAKRHSSCTNSNRRTSSNTVFGGSGEVKKNLSESCVIDATKKSSSPAIASPILPKREYSAMQPASSPSNNNDEHDRTERLAIPCGGGVDGDGDGHVWVAITANAVYVICLSESAYAIIFVSGLKFK